MKHAASQLPSNKHGAVKVESIRAATSVVVRVLVPEIKSKIVSPSEHKHAVYNSQRENRIHQHKLSFSQRRVSRRVPEGRLVVSRRTAPCIRVSFFSRDTEFSQSITDTKL